MRGIFSFASKALSAAYEQVRGTPAQRALQTYNNECDRVRAQGGNPEKDKGCLKLEQRYEQMKRQEERQRAPSQKPA